MPGRDKRVKLQEDLRRLRKCYDYPYYYHSYYYCHDYCDYRLDEYVHYY